MRWRPETARPPAARRLSADAVEVAPRPGALFRRGPARIHDLGDGFCWIYLDWEGRALRLSAEDARLLCVCEPFGPLARHAARYWAPHAGRTRAQRGQREVLRRLALLATAGALVSLDDLLERCAASGWSPAPRPGIGWIAIPTCDRPGALARSLRSFAANAEKFGHHPAILVSDDSRDPAATARVEAIVAAVARRTGLEVFFSGRAERADFARLLTSRGIPAAVAEFALFGRPFDGPTLGANRNALLLHCVGDMLLSLDDDTICRPGARWESLATSGTVSLSGDGDPTELGFFPDRSAALEGVEPLNLDVLAEHERYLGRSVAQVVADNAAEFRCPDLAHACEHGLRSAGDGLATVSLTLNGIAGDSGMHTGGGLLTHARAETRSRLHGSPEALALGLRSRDVVRQALSPSIYHNGPVMGVFLGIDNRGLTPPFPPVFRGEDTVFGALVQLVGADAYFAQLPFCLPHDPSGARRYAFHRWSSMRVADYLVAFCLASGALAGPPENRLRDLGRRLTDLGSLDEPAFEEAVRGVLIGRAAAFARHGEALLAGAPSAPAFWREAVTSEYRDLQRFTLDIQSRSGGARSPAAADATGVQLRRLLREFGEMLAWWPTMVAAARELRESGQTLAKAVARRAAARA